MNNSSEMIIADKDQINHKLEEKSKFMVVVNILDELYALSITNLSESDEKTYTCWTQNVSFNTTNITSFRLYLKSMYVLAERFYVTNYSNVFYLRFLLLPIDHFYDTYVLLQVLYSFDSYLLSGRTS